MGNNSNGCSVVRRAFAAVLVTSLCLAGCGGEEEGSGPPIEPIECWTGGGAPEGGEADGMVEIGTGPGDFQPIEADQELELHLGTQGLAHFFVNARVVDMEPGAEDDDANLPYILFSATLEDGTKVGVGECASRLPFTEPLDGGHTLGGTRLLVIDGLYIEPIQGQPILLTVEVLDRDGRYASDQRRVVPVVLDPRAGPR
jgi:hypothetical protein